MDDTKSVVCRLCLKTIQEIAFKLLKNIELRMLDILIPSNIYISNGSAICRTCHKNLLASYGFKSICLEVNDRKKSLEDGDLDYEDAQPAKVGVCGLCFQNIDDEMLREILLGVKDTLLAIMLERCLPELDNHRTVTAACTECFKSLEVTFSFINDCQITEEKIEKFCIAKNLNEQTELKLLDVTKFFQTYSENIDRQQITNSRDSSNCSNFTSTSDLLISNIKSEPVDEFDNTERNEEAFENSCMNMIPEINTNNTNYSKFISSNDFSQVNVKLEPVEDIHEFTGNNKESYLNVGPERCDSDINNAERASQDLFPISDKSKNVESKGFDILPTRIVEWLQREGWKSSGWSSELMAEIQALRKKGSPSNKRFRHRFITANGRFVHLRIPPLINSNDRDKSVCVNMKEIPKAKPNPEDVNGKVSFVNNKRVKIDEQNKAKVEKELYLCQDPSELVVPDFANLNPALQREPTLSDHHDGPNKKKRKYMPSTATPTYKDSILHNNSLKELRISGDPSDWSSPLLLQLQQAALLPEGHYNNINQRPQCKAEAGESVGIKVSRAKSKLETPDCLPDLHKNCTTPSGSKGQFFGNPGSAQEHSLYKTESKKSEMTTKIVYRKISRAVLILDPVNKCENYIAPYHPCPLGHHEGFCAATIGLAEQIRASHYPWTPEIWQRLAVFFIEGSIYKRRQKLEFRTVAGERVVVHISPAQLKLDPDKFSQVTSVNNNYFKNNSWKGINSESESNSWLVEQLLATPEPVDWSPILRRRLATLFPEGCPDNKWVTKKLRIDDRKVICLSVSREMLELKPTLYKGNGKVLVPRWSPSGPCQWVIGPYHQCKFGAHKGFCSLTIGVAEQLQSNYKRILNPALSQRLAVFLQEGCLKSKRQRIRFYTVSGEVVRFTIHPRNLTLGDINEDFFEDKSWDELIASELKHKNSYKQQCTNTNEEEVQNTISLRSATPLPLPYRIAANWLVKQLLDTPQPDAWSPTLRERLTTLIPASTPDDEWLIPRFVTTAGDIFYVRICRQMLRLKQDTN